MQTCSIDMYDIQITHQVTEFDKEELLAGLRSHKCLARRF